MSFNEDALTWVDSGAIQYPNSSTMLELTMQPDCKTSLG